MHVFARITLCFGLLLTAVICAVLAISVPEAPRESWPGFWFIYGLVGLCCLVGAGFLLPLSGLKK